MTETTTDDGWLDNETWEPEQVAEMVRRYRVHADLLAALEDLQRWSWTLPFALREADIWQDVDMLLVRARGIGQNIDTKA